MKIPELLEDLAIISQLGDNPGSDDGLSAEALKAKFDEAALKIQKYINTVLIPAVNPAVIPHDYFAPAGYGLGGYGEEKGIASISALDNFKANGKFTISQTVGSPLVLEGIYFNSLLLEVSMLNANYGTQIVRFIDGGTIRRVCKGGVWQPWEWVNPPMVPGVEYRTTERFDGKAVYTQLVNCGIAAHNASITIPGVTRCVRYIGYISPPHESYPIKPLPAWSGDTIGAGYHAEVTQPVNPYADGQFIIKTDSNADSIGGGGYTWFVQAWYTKD